MPRPDLRQSYRPKQNIPESQKNESWAMDNVDWCISAANIYRNHPEQQMYNFYNGKRSTDDFEHITQTFGVEFPAGKIKHIPLIRPLLNTLASEQQERPFNFIVRAEDSDAISAKQEQISQTLLQQIFEMIQQGADIDSTMDNLEKYWKETFQTDMEIATHHAMKDYISKHHLEQDFQDNFIDKLITGREYYRCRVNRIGEDPEFETIRPGHLYYADNPTKWVKECDWAVHPVLMSPTEILDVFGDKMTQDDYKRIEDWQDLYYRDAYKIRSPEEADDILRDSEDIRSWNGSLYNKITVYYVEWKSTRKVSLVENPNQYVSDAPFVKFIDQDKLYRLKNSKKNNIKHRFVQDLWQGVRIADDIYVDMGKVRTPLRDARYPSRVFLSFNGLTYNGKVKPYSLVKVTKDIQDLYDIMHFHKENLIAMSGTRGAFMDISQMPDFGTDNFAENLKMWMYYKKMGAAFIDRSQEGADRTYNQFGTYDDTISPGLNIVLGVITHLEEVAGRLVGVNRQRQGAIAQTDGKATTEQAIIQSNLVTETIFNDHDEFVRHALEDILNACRIAWQDGYTGSYVSDQYMQTIFTLDPNFALSNYGVYITNKVSDARSIEELKSFSYQLIQRGMMELEDVTPLFRKSNFKDIETTILRNIERRKKMLEQQQNQAAQMQQQLEMATKQAEVGKLNADIAKIQADIEKNKEEMNLEAEKLMNDKTFNEGKLALDSQRVSLEAQQLNIAGTSAGAAEVRDK